MSLSDSRVPRPSRMINRPEALGSSVPACPTFLMPKCRRIRSTTSCEVGPIGLSTNNAPSNGSNDSMFPGIGLALVQRFLEGINNLPLDGERTTCDARTGCGGMAAAAEAFRHFIDVDLIILRTQADPCQLRL